MPHSVYQKHIYLHVQDVPPFLFDIVTTLGLSESYHQKCWFSLDEAQFTERNHATNRRVKPAVKCSNYSGLLKLQGQGRPDHPHSPVWPSSFHSTTPSRPTGGDGREGERERERGRGRETPRFKRERRGYVNDSNICT